jgi:hypothetical protein
MSLDHIWSGTEGKLRANQPADRADRAEAALVQAGAEIATGAGKRSERSRPCAGLPDGLS